MTNQKIGSFIAALRKEHALTQEQLAEKLGVSNRSVSRWENGNTLPDLSLMQTLCTVLDVRMSELLIGQRHNENTHTQECITLAMELAQREQAKQRKLLNLCFAAGFGFLLVAALHSGLNILSLISAPFQQTALWLCIGLGVVFMLCGFYFNNKIRTVSNKEIAVLTTTESALRMKTAEEMLQFARKYQHGEQKQHQQAFEALAKQLDPGEYVLFTFIADSCSINGSPGPWHISAAVSHRRILLSGETMRGRIMTSFATGSYDRSELKSIKLQAQKLVLQFDDILIKFDGNHFEDIIEKLKLLLL